MARARDGTELHIEGPIMHHAIPRSTEKGGKLGESRGPGARDREYLPECVLAWTDWVQTSLTGEASARLLGLLQPTMPLAILQPTMPLAILQPTMPWLSFGRAASSVVQEISSWQAVP